jgi:hypothetical protein
MSVIRRSSLLLLLLWPLLLASCGGGTSGVYVNLGDAEDRVELEGSTGRVAALRGQALDVWLPPAAKGRGVVGELQAAQRAMREVEMVDVQVEALDSGRTIRLVAPGRGSRLLQFDPQSDEILTGGQRKYFRR